VFHHSTILRELLRANNSNRDASVLPQELILEVLDTIHTVLFPSGPDSYKLLELLISKKGFDSRLLTYASTPYRRPEDPKVPYTYFRDRLLALHKEL